ncbi:hypothetical protein GW916_14965 [bacterium]|nr:hypothetical protein [bacterium]
MTKKIALALTAFMTTLASAEITTLPMDYGFLKENPEELAILAPGEVFQSYQIKNSSDWNASVLGQSELFKGFRSFESWIVESDSNERVVYSSEVALVVNKKITQDDLNKIKDPNFLSQIDPSFSHQALDAQVALNEFLEAQKGGQTSALRSLEMAVKKKKVKMSKADSMYVAIVNQLDRNLQANFCKTPESSCLTSTAIFSGKIQSLMSAAKKYVTDKIPDKVELMSEVRNATSEELGSATAGVVQTGFLANKFIISTKNIILAKALPDGSTLLSIATYAEFEKDDLEELGKIPLLNPYELIVGESSLYRGEGLAQGLPAYSAQLAKSLSEKL